MNAKILFVDDDANILASFRRRLGRRYYITTAMSGEQALEVLVNQGPFAVVICDERMRRVSGIDVLQMIREKSPSTVRMMLTGNTDWATEMRAKKEAGVFRYFTKPCRTEELVDAIKAGVREYEAHEAHSADAKALTQEGPRLTVVS